MTQARRSNPWGFGDWTRALPARAKPLLERMRAGDLFGTAAEVDNLQKVWRKAIRVGDLDVVVVAVETKA